jgi:hypothetical protein
MPARLARPAVFLAALPLLVLPAMLGGCADLARPHHIRVSKADPAAADALIEIPPNAVRKLGPDGQPYLEIPADDGSFEIPGYGRFVPTR